MAKTTALNAKNLEALGAERLAALLIEISTGDAVAKRRLRMDLAGAQSPAELGKEVRKRLAAIGRARAFVDWRGIKPLAVDLETQSAAIAGAIARRDPVEALDLLWRFMELAKPIFLCCDDSNGHISLIFHQACEDLGAIAVLAKPSAQALAEQSFRALLANDYGQFDGLIAALAKALGKVGLNHLKQLLIDLSNQPVEKPAAKDRIKIGYGSAGPIYQDEIAERSRVSTVKLALREIADAQGDVDAFIAQYDAKPARCRPLPPRSPRGCSRQGGWRKPGVPSRRPHPARAPGKTGWILSGRMPASQFWTRWAAPRRPRPCGGTVLNARFRYRICGII